MSNSAAGPAELVFARVFEAPRELVFQCMTQPEHLTHFWGPAGTSAPVEHITLDPRPGGVFETVMINDADGSRYPTQSVYDDVAPPGLVELVRHPGDEHPVAHLEGVDHRLRRDEEGLGDERLDQEGDDERHAKEDGQLPEQGTGLRRGLLDRSRPTGLGDDRRPARPRTAGTARRRCSGGITLRVGFAPRGGRVSLHAQTSVGQNRFSLTLAAFPTRSRR